MNKLIFVSETILKRNLRGENMIRTIDKIMSNK